MAAAVRLKPLLFAIHTYYALLMKLIAHELLALQHGFGVASFVEGVGSADDEKLKEKLGYLESGSDFKALGIVNFLDADFFSWYLDTWSKRLALAARGIVRALAHFEPATPVLDPDWTRDLLQKLYELIVPRVLRHSLGEYYTPDWLAGYLVEKSEYSGDPGLGFSTRLAAPEHFSCKLSSVRPSLPRDSRVPGSPRLGEQFLTVWLDLISTRSRCSRRAPTTLLPLPGSCHTCGRLHPGIFAIQSCRLIATRNGRLH